MTDQSEVDDFVAAAVERYAADLLTKGSSIDISMLIQSFIAAGKTHTSAARLARAVADTMTEYGIPVIETGNG